MYRDIYRPKMLYHPPASALPPGFKYPKAYLEHVSQKEIIELYPWSFLCHANDTKHYNNWLQILKEQYPDRRLVPFAKWMLDDDIACFEQSENPDLPRVHYIHSFTDPGYEERGSHATFEEWLSDALEESAAFQADFPDYADDFVDERIRVSI